MGNSSSSSTAPQRTAAAKHDARGRTTSPSPVPVPGQPHASMRTKRRSLQLPGLSLTPSQPRGRQSSPPKSAAINIPKPNDPHLPAPRRAQNNFSSSDLIAPATHIPFPPPRPQGSVSSYARPYRSRGPQPMPSIYDQAHNRPPTPPSPAPFVREVVQSTIPTGLLSDAAIKLEEDEALAGIRPEDSLLTEPVAVKITWRGGGKIVVLARAGDDDWNGRQPMERESPSSNTWQATIDLLPGTHHIRFLVDDQWRVADDLPAAVDDQGSLANYINVQPHSPPPQPSPLPPAASPPQKLRQPGQSFWSAASSTDDPSEDYRPSHDKSIHAQIIQARWTNVLPPELTEAAREEETYLTASAGQYDANTRGVHVSGFVPAPNIPPAPGMPRHLDKLILNTKVTLPSQQGGAGSNAGSPSRGSSTLPRGVGSGQGGREREKREGRERRRREGEKRRGDRDRERERREDREPREERERGEQKGHWRDSGYANFPPAPPPSEDGSGAGLDDKPEHSPVRGAPGQEAEQPISTAVTTPETTQTTQVLSKEPQTKPQTTTTPQQAATPQRPGPSPLATESRTPVSGSRAITLDMENMPALTDDASVLPVPSHVVLQHLCTSAIRNGVLAIATTTRYRNKHMTTVYYKPT